MYALINEQVDDLLQTINPAKDVQPYLWLIETLPNVDVVSHREFQRVYRRYWQMNMARLSPEFHSAYFSHLEHLKGQTEIHLESVARYLFTIPTKCNGDQTLQFSFATKLVHMLRPQQPVYDSMIASFFFFPSGKSMETNNAKLIRLLSCYKFLCEEYIRVIGNGLLERAIRRFRDHFRVGANYSDEKIIDTLIWNFVGFLKSGAVTSQPVVYS
jgi:hypothetical protein